MSKVLKFAAPPETLAQLVDRAATLKEAIEAQQEALRQINLELADRAEYKDGGKTGHIFGTQFSAKVSLRENVKWDQATLEALRLEMGDEEFFRVFSWTFSPKSAKTLAGALEFGQFGAQIAAARTVTPGAPSVTYEKMEAC